VKSEKANRRHLRVIEEHDAATCSSESVDNARAGGNMRKPSKACWAHFQKLISLAVAFEFTVEIVGLRLV